MVVHSFLYNPPSLAAFHLLIQNQIISIFKSLPASNSLTAPTSFSTLQPSPYTMSSSTSSTMPTASKPSKKYQHSGRGGAGNYRKAPAAVSSSSSSVFSSTSTSSKSSRFSTGVGGFGNHHSHSGNGFFRAFCNEVSRKRPAVTTRDVYHVGVGGAGNVKN
jgi:hypothetical protein